MGLEDLAMFRAIPNSIVLYPSDAVSTEKALELATAYNGIVYIKGGRSNHPILYKNDEEFLIKQAKILKSSEHDVITVVSGGVPVFECLKSYDLLQKEGINIRIVDIFSIKPIDEELLKKCVDETNGLMLVVEDHYEEGGIGGNEII